MDHDYQWAFVICGIYTNLTTIDNNYHPSNEYEIDFSLTDSSYPSSSLAYNAYVFDDVNIILYLSGTFQD